MSERKWFLLENDTVSGPWTQSQADEKLHSSRDKKIKIWWRGQNEWVNEESWRAQLTNEADDQKNKPRLWRIKNGDEKLGTMTHEEMMTWLKVQKDFSRILIWTEGYKDWKEIYHIHSIMDELGVSRRQHPRVPMMGKVEFETPQGKLEFRIITISEGGFGIAEAQNLRIGSRFKVSIESPNLYLTIHSTAEVLFIASDGNAGCKFVGIQSESKSAIIEYVKKFSDANKR